MRESVFEESPPAHVNCSCKLQEIMNRYWIQKPGLPWTEIDGGQFENCLAAMMEFPRSWEHWKLLHVEGA
jgi:hypothetical protein